MSVGKIEKINLELLLEHSANLPASPRIFARLSALIKDEDTALDYISSLVKMDPGLAAQILRVTNSAYYGASIKVNDLETAISRIGFREVQKVLSMVVARDCFYQAVPVYGLTATDFSDECVAGAVVSETLAKRAGFDPSAPYITGLLHRIGKLAINLYLEKMDAVVDLSAQASNDKPIEEVEQEILGITHLQVGFELLRHWQFEAGIWHAIKNQCSLAQTLCYKRETALLGLAIWITKTIDDSYDPDSTLPDDTTWALNELAIDPMDIVMLTDNARFEVNDRRNILAMLL